MSEGIEDITYTPMGVQQGKNDPLKSKDFKADVFKGPYGLLSIAVSLKYTYP